MSSLRACSAVLAAGLLLTAAPASAADGITAPGTGEVVTVDGLVPLRAVVDGPVSEPSELSLLAPGATSAEVVAVSTDPAGGELAHDLDTSCTAAVCGGRTPAANGTWTLRLSGAAEDERTFVLRIPPAAPVDVAADPSEAGVRLRWAQGDEPDLRGYRVEDQNGKAVRDRLGLDVCDPDRACQVELPGDGGTYAVRAYRATCPDCTELLTSPASALVRAEGDAGPQPAADVVAPAPSPSAAPAGPPRSRPDQRSAFLGAFGALRPGAPAAVPAPAQRAVPPAPPAGSFDAELGYGEQELVVRERRAPLGRAGDAIGATVATGERVRLLVLSGLMIGGALWLRRWARRVITE